MHAALAARERLALSVLMLDVDHFKKYNDAFGHLAGDEALRLVAALLKDGVRLHDVVVRYGGEEFVVLLPATDATAAIEVAERLRSSIEQCSGLACPVTASFGVATADQDAMMIQNLVEQADQALYLAKESGRNCVRHFRQSSSWSPSSPLSRFRAGPPGQNNAKDPFASRERSA